MQVRRRVAHQPVDDADRLGVEAVHLVEGQQAGRGVHLDAVREQPQAVVAALEIAARRARCEDVEPREGERERQVGGQPVRVVVVVEAEPGRDPPTATLASARLGDQSGLAEATGRVEHREPASHRVAYGLERGALDEAVRGIRQHDLLAQEPPPRRSVAAVAWFAAVCLVCRRYLICRRSSSTTGAELSSPFASPLTKAAAHRAHVPSGTALPHTLREPACWSTPPLPPHDARIADHPELPDGPPPPASKPGDDCGAVASRPNKRPALPTAATARDLIAAPRRVQAKPQTVLVANRAVRIGLSDHHTLTHAHVQGGRRRIGRRLADSSNPAEFPGESADLGIDDAATGVVGHVHELRNPPLSLGIVH